MSMQDNDPDVFEQRTRELLRASTEQLDAHARSRLAQARMAAVEEARKRRTPFAWRMWLPVGGMVAATLAVLLWSGSLKHSGPLAPGTAQTPLDDLDLIATDENLEMMEDVDFYAWLDTEAAAQAADGIG